MTPRTLLAPGFLLIAAAGAPLVHATQTPNDRDAPAAAPAKKSEKPADAGKNATPKKPDELVEQALKTAEAGDFKKAVALLDQALKAEPDNKNALWLLAQVATRQSRDAGKDERLALHLRAASAMRKLRAASRTLSPIQKEFLCISLYNEACVYALEGKKDRAMKSLAESVDEGFDQPEMLAADEDLKSLHDLPEFRALRKSLTAKLDARAREQARDLLDRNTSFTFDFKLPDVNGKTVALGDLKGKVAIVDIWGTWCPPCRAEVPEFVALYQAYHDKGLEIVGINYEQEDDETKVKEAITTFVKEHKVPYPCVIGDTKTQDQVPGFEGFPTTLFLDRSGKVRAKLVGFDPSHARVLKALVQELLAEKPGKDAAKP